LRSRAGLARASRGLAKSICASRGSAGRIVTAVKDHRMEWPQPHAHTHSHGAQSSPAAVAAATGPQSSNAAVRTGALAAQKAQANAMTRRPRTKKAETPGMCIAQYKLERRRCEASGMLFRPAQGYVGRHGLQDQRGVTWAAAA